MASRTARSRPDIGPGPQKVVLPKRAVRDWMTASTKIAARTDSVLAVDRVMREFGLRHVPVLEERKIVGVLSQKDLAFLDAVVGAACPIERVEDAMSQEVYGVEARASLLDVVTEMADRNYPCVVVLDQGNVVGVFDVNDALRAFGACLTDHERR
jgi:CBS domain-containing protein